MPKAQGSLEYLLIAVAVFGMVIGAVLVMNSVLSAPSHQRDIELDKIDCGNSHIWLKQYFTAYNGTLDSAPGAISYYQAGEMPKSPTTVAASAVTGETACTLQGKYHLNFSRAEGKAWLQTSKPDEWVEYSGAAAANTPRIVLVGNDSVVKTPNFPCGCGYCSRVAYSSDEYYYLHFQATNIPFHFAGTATLTVRVSHIGQVGSAVPPKLGAHNTTETDYAGPSQSPILTTTDYNSTEVKVGEVNFTLNNAIIRNGDIYLAVNGTPADSSHQTYICMVTNPPYITLS